MSAIVQTTDMPVTLKLSELARSKLMEEAARSGQDVAAVASDLIEHAVAVSSIDEIMEPVRKQIAESGMTGEEFDELLRNEIQAVRTERKAKSS